jgi:DNA-binding transcriptional ArsR family regulator
MESKIAVEALSALAHDGRLAAFRLLVRAGDEGLPSGELARLLDVPANTLSTNLGILSRAGLIKSQRDGRSIIYAANYEGMSRLVTFLMKDCCQGRAEVCATSGALTS